MVCGTSTPKKEELTVPLSPDMVESMEYAIVILAALLAVREFIHYRERKDMLDRLMAKSLPEFKDNSKAEENKFEIDDDGTSYLEEVKQELNG